MLYLCVAGALMIFGGPVIESRTQAPITCTVTSSHASTARSGIKTQSSSAEVVIDTKDCGTLAMTNGVDFDNSAEIAAGVEVGHAYTFSTGAYSRVVLRGMLRRPLVVTTYSKE